VRGRLFIIPPPCGEGGRPKAGRVGVHNGSSGRSYPHPGLRFWTMLRIIQARPTTIEQSSIGPRKGEGSHAARELKKAELP
jgi:hypothetical protein